MIKAYKIKVKGRVQGVGFRYYTLNMANKFKVKGTVQNINDYVEIVCRGNPDNLSEFLAKVRKGPALSNVLKLDIEEIENQKNLAEFKII
ncbi:MAG: acylphosphatase [Candidatus Woesearchaeota archaeon]